MSQPSSEDRFVNPTVGKKFWIKHTYDVLVETASRYNTVITYGTLADEVQRRSGLHTTAATRNWVSDLLKMVAQANHLRGEPALASLVVHAKDGHVGAGFEEVLRLEGRAVTDPHEREHRAAIARLECYRRWSGDVPEDAEPTPTILPRPGGAPRPSGAPRHVVAPREAGTRTTSGPAPRPRSREERRGNICPTCFMEMPVAGPCPNCS